MKRAIDIPWNWFRPGPERDAARAREKRLRQGMSTPPRSRATAAHRALTRADRNDEIRRLWVEGWSGVALSERFGVARSTVSGLVADLRRDRRYGDPEDIAWPHPRRRAPGDPDPAVALPPRAFPKVREHDPADVLGGFATACKGSAHGRSKLTEDLVVEMRRLRLRGWSTGRLAQHFNVARNTVCYACNGSTWSHVPNPPTSEGIS